MPRPALALALLMAALTGTACVASKSYTPPAKTFYRNCGAFCETNANCTALSWDGCVECNHQNRCAPSTVLCGASCDTNADCELVNTNAVGACTACQRDTPDRSSCVAAAPSARCGKACVDTRDCSRSSDQCTVCSESGQCTQPSTCGRRCHDDAECDTAYGAKCGLCRSQRCVAGSPTAQCGHPCSNSTDCGTTGYCTACDAFRCGLPSTPSPFAALAVAKARRSLKAPRP